MGIAGAVKKFSSNVKISVDSIGTHHQNSGLTHP